MHIIIPTTKQLNKNLNNKFQQLFQLLYTELINAQQYSIESAKFAKFSWANSQSLFWTAKGKF